MITGLSIAITAVIGSTIILELVNWLTHIMITKGNVKIYGWGSFNKFKREYNKHNWDYENITNEFYCFHFDRSRWERSTESTLHASIVIFDGKGMLLDTISMILVSIWLMRIDQKGDYL